VSAQCAYNLQVTSFGKLRCTEQNYFTRVKKAHNIRLLLQQFPKEVTQKRVSASNNILSSRKIVGSSLNLKTFFECLQELNNKEFFIELQERKYNTIYENSLVECAYNETYTFQFGK